MQSLPAVHPGSVAPAVVGERDTTGLSQCAVRPNVVPLTGRAPGSARGAARGPRAPRVHGTRASRSVRAGRERAATNGRLWCTIVVTTF